MHPRNQGLLQSRDIITGSIEFVPFVMKVSEIGVFDSKQASPMKPNSLSVNALWRLGRLYYPSENSGSDAYWVGLTETWRFVVEEGASCT